MNFNFIEKLDERTYAGLFAVVNQLVSAAEFCESKFEGSSLCIHVPSLERLFYRLDQEACTCDASVDIRQQIAEDGYMDPSNAHSDPILESLKKKHQTFTMKFAFRDPELKALERNPDERILGVHLRGTDKFKEIVPTSTMQIRRRISAIISQNKIEKVYLATDDKKYETMMKKHFSNFLVESDRAFLGSSRKPTHLGGLSADELGEVDYQALRDAVILSQCSHFLYSYSNLSYFALMLGANTHVLTAPLNSEPPDLGAVVLHRAFSFLSFFTGLLRRVFEVGSAVVDRGAPRLKQHDS